jgi:hypothetical protein
MDTNEARRQTLALMHAHGLTQNGWTFTWDRAKNRFGACRYARKQISLSFPLTALGAEDEVTNTIIHEVAHALTPGAGHGYAWRAKFLEMGGDGKRCASGEGARAAAAVVAKYRLECAVDGRVLGTVNRKGKRLVNATCTCHSVRPNWITQN